MTELHWERVHASQEHNAVSWWQEANELWDDVILGLGLPMEAPIVDIGAGSSMLLDALLARGFCNLTAVDISPAALARLNTRVGAGIDLVAADVLNFTTDVPVRLWHDRAVFHFLVDPADQAHYRENLHASLAEDGYAMICTFAPDGPETCSGLPVQRYDAEQLSGVLGLSLVSELRRIHTTPRGSEQSFTLAVLQP
jgi:SAM-dependent methyltransferase